MDVSSAHLEAPSPNFETVPLPWEVIIPAAIGVLAGWKISGWLNLRNRRVTALAMGVAAAGGYHLAEKAGQAPFGNGPSDRLVTSEEVSTKREQIWDGLDSHKPDPDSVDVLDAGKRVGAIFRALSPDIPPTETVPEFERATEGARDVLGSIGKLKYLDLSGVGRGLKEKVEWLTKARSEPNLVSLDGLTLECLEGGKLRGHFYPRLVALDMTKGSPVTLLEQAVKLELGWSARKVVFLVDDVGRFSRTLRLDRQHLRSWISLLNQLGSKRDEGSPPLEFHLWEKPERGDGPLKRVSGAQHRGLGPITEVWKRGGPEDLAWHQRIDALFDLAQSVGEEWNRLPSMFSSQEKADVDLQYRVRSPLFDNEELSVWYLRECSDYLLRWGWSTDPLVNELKYALLNGVLVAYCKNVPLKLECLPSLDDGVGIFRDHEQAERFQAFVLQVKSSEQQIKSSEPTSPPASLAIQPI